MKTGKCPKCGTSEIRVRKVEMGSSGSLHAGREPVNLVIAAMTGADLDVYVCTRCGFLETYVADRDRGKLSILADKWAKPR